MKEHTRKKVNVLGIDVSVMRPDKAVNISMNYINRKEVSVIFFHSAASSLFCQEQEWATQLVDSCNLVLAGDRHMEDAISHTSSAGDITPGNGLFADTYIKRLLFRLNKDNREIFTIMYDEENLKLFRDYLQTSFPDIIMEGTVLSEVSEQEAGRVVNEINGVIPDIVFICLPSQLQLQLLRSHQVMMNTHLIIGIESLQPLLITEAVTVPDWVKSLHLTGIYQWFHKRSKLQEQIIGSIFRQTVQDKNSTDSDKSPDRSMPELLDETNEENQTGEE